MTTMLTKRKKYMMTNAYDTMLSFREYKKSKESDS